MPADFAVWGDQAALEVILKNLIDNGIKYSGDSPKVEVRAYRESGRVYIEVRDHGIGISTQHRKRIFQRFFRVPTVSVRQRKGTGLGLFVVQSLVRNLGGKVSADSEGEGKGTTIRVRLPEPRSREADHRRG
jgi:signal transduction histidine kinase